jgi:hyaluronan synthase
MISLKNKVVSNYKDRSINAWIVFFLCIYIVLLVKFITFQQFNTNIILAIYSFAITFYVLSRFSIAYFHEPEDQKFDKNYEPTLTFGIPSKNEVKNIRETIVRIAKSDYNKKKFDIVAINDGSDDNTLAEMRVAKNIVSKMGVKMKIINWKENKGKREGMAECVRQSKNDIVIFIDSDSFIEKDTAAKLVKYFSDKKVGAVAAHGYVGNPDDNIITKMQAVRYYVSFKAYKGSESMFGSVMCCSGCCSAYRREYLTEKLDEWTNQSFLGVKCTYGDDRSLTNMLLVGGYKTLYAPEATVHTFVPSSLSLFMKQQLRWKKSWVRESFFASKFMWKKNPLMSISFYLGFILPLRAPFVVLRALVWYPYTTGNVPYFYLFGVFIMSMIYGLYYYIHTKDGKWLYGVAFATFYSTIMIWQLPYAILNLRDSRWGTR